MLATTIDVEQIDEVFPVAIQRLQVRGNLFTASELFVVRINLVLHPAQIFDSFALARIEPFDDSFALRVAQLVRAFLFSARDQTSIKWGGRNYGKVKGLSRQRGRDNLNLLKVYSRDGKAGHAPKIDRLSECLFHIPKIDLGQFH